MTKVCKPEEKEICLSFMGDPWLDWGAVNFAESAKELNASIETDAISWKIALDENKDTFIESIEKKVLSLSTEAQQRVIVSGGNKPVLQETCWWKGNSRLSDSNPPTSTHSTTIEKFFDDENVRYCKLIKNCAQIYVDWSNKLRKQEELLNLTKEQEKKDSITAYIKKLKSKLENKDRSIEAFAAAVLAYEIKRIVDEKPKCTSDEFFAQLVNISQEFSEQVKKSLKSKWDKLTTKKKTFDDYVKSWKIFNQPINRFHFSYGKIKSKAKLDKKTALEIMQDYIPHVTQIDKGANCVSGFSKNTIMKLSQDGRVRALSANQYLGFFCRGKDLRIYFFPVADTAEHLDIVARDWRGFLKDAPNRSNIPQIDKYEKEKIYLQKPYEIEWAILFEIYCYIKNMTSHRNSQLWRNHVSVCFIREDTIDREYRVFHRLSEFIRLLDLIITENEISMDNIRTFFKNLSSKVSKNDKHTWLWREQICQRFLSFQDIGVPFMNLCQQEKWENDKNTKKPRFFPYANKIIPAYYKALNQLNREKQL